jgi:hypothetical protein
VQAARRFDRWRARRATRRIPGELWALAAELGVQHGVSGTARALHVHYADLKRHVEVSLPSGQAASPSSPFVEIRTVEPRTAASCRVELERASGEVMRLFLPTGSEEALVLLTRVFLEGRP